MMSVQGFKFSVKTSWPPTESKDPTETISLGHSSDPSERSEDYEGEIRHEINSDNLVRFARGNDEEPCVVTIKIIEPEWTITKISVVSEVRTIELYGPYGEYIATSRGTNISDSCDQCLYNAQPDVSVRHELSIKFPGAMDFLWIYGIKLLVKKVELPPPAGTFDYHRVDEMLNASKLPITDTAEKAKQFLQKYMSSGSTERQPDPRAILKILEGEYRTHMKPMEDAGRNVSQYIANLMSVKQKKDSETESVSDVKSYVDNSIKQLEERVQNNLKLQLEAFEEKQNQKLDQILQLLASKT
uniref:Methionine--tRNA ligase n=1 Tax=Lygus hesperus TaxID=30085 RepID=A0A0A9XT41_LYGHE